MYQKNVFKIEEEIVYVELDSQKLEGELVIPEQAEGIVVFAHGSGSSRYSTRNRYLAHILRQAGLATLLIDLLTKEEEIIEQRTQYFGGNVAHLSSRLIKVTNWLTENPSTHHLAIGYLGDRIGGAAALTAACEHPQVVRAVVTRASKTNLVSTSFASLVTPTLLIVGGNDLSTLSTNKHALSLIPAEHKQLEIIANASQNFDEPSMLREVARLASGWFQQYLTSTTNQEFHLYAMSLL